MILAACSVSFEEGKTARPKIDELKRQVAEAKPGEAAVTRKEVAPSEGAPLLVEKAKTWQEALDLLPKDKAGNVDWVQALEVGAIAPRQSLEPTAPGYLELDLEVDLTSSKSKIFWVTFPHEAHTQLLRCKSCHSRFFPLRRGSEPPAITMAKIKAGRYCGACHGDVSFGVKGECARCHTRVSAKAKWRPSDEPQRPVERARTWDEVAKLVPVTDGLPDWAKALADGVIVPRPGIDPKAAEQPIFPLDVELVPADNPIFKAVFPHGPHTALLACANCHFGIFQMAAGADPITMDKIYRGEYCGRCHGKVAFAVPTGCPRCHPVLRGQ
jgi:c(7)-type cytochrome triheme protein